MPKIKTELKRECVRLRVEERLSYQDIQKRTGASKGSLSLWLKGYPLTETEQKTSFRKHRNCTRKSRGEKSKFYTMIEEKNTSRLSKARIAEAAVLFRLCLHGMAVFGSPFDGDRADCVYCPMDSTSLSLRDNREPT